MKNSRLIIIVMVGVAAVGIVWRVGFYKPPTKSVKKGAEAKLPPTETFGGDKPLDVKRVAEANEPRGVSDVNRPRRFAGFGEPNRPFGMRRSDRMQRFGEQGGEGGPSFGPPSFAESDEMRGAGEPNRPGGMGMGFGESRRFGEPNRPSDGNEPMEALNLREVEMKSIIQKLAEWTGKVIIPAEDAMKQRVTIYAAEKMPRSQALAHIYGALRMKGYVAEQSDNVIYITAMKDAKLGFVPTIPAGQPLALIENREQIVQKFFKLVSYKPTQMGQVIQPLIGEHGYVSADETTGTLLVIDTVSNLMRIERIITEFDVPEAGQTVTQVFTVQHGDPSEIVQLLKMLLGTGDTGSSSSSGGGRGSERMGRFMGTERIMPPGMGQSSSSSEGAAGSGSRTGGATSVVVGKTQGTVVLIPEPRRKWIIARASPETMKQISEWIQKLDIEGPVESEYEVIGLMYANPADVQKGIEQTMKDMAGTGLTPSIIVQPLERQVLVAGRKDLRELAKKLIEEIDVPPGVLQTEHFKLKYADPDQVKTNIEELYSSGALSSTSGRGISSYGYSSYGTSRTASKVSDTVRVISYASLRQVTVIASPENLEKIRKQIEEWDRPLDVNEVKPRIIELHNSDPVEMADLMTTLFSESSSSGRTSIYDILFGTSQSQQKIVGALYGQLTFEDVPGTKKIIVISKIPEAYDVVEQLIRDLDKEEMGEIPRVITLKYADPEDLAERLNAMFNQPGTTASIRRSTQGLSSASTTSSTTSGTTSSTSSSTQSGTTGTTGTSSTSYTPPWSGQGARTTTGEEMPISNVIGKVRFVPETHSKSLLVLAPPEFMSNIEALVQELDIPGKQVMVKAVIVEVKHSDLTSLGLQLASNPSAFGTLNENSMTALSQLIQLDKSGTALVATNTTSSGTTFTTKETPLGGETATIVTANVSMLIDFLIKKVHAQILNQQTLWTKDNGEAIFFKGDNVALQTAASVSGTTGMTTSSYEFTRVGMTLRVRPRITPEKNVDMILNIILSQLTSELVNLQPKRTEMETTTNMIVQNGQTVMLGGILFQQDSRIERKMPLLGDLPLVGGLFRHNNVEQSNNELIVFVTPFVIDEGQQISPEASREMAQPMERLQDIQKHLKDTAEQLEQPSQQEQD